MRKLINIVNEYQIINSTPWENVPTSENSQPVGYILNSEWIIKAARSPDSAYFWIEHAKQDVAYASIKSVGDYVAFGEAFVLPEFQGKGLMSELMNWVIRQNNQKLINDTQISGSGLKLWNGLMKSMTTSIVDIATGQSYSIDDAAAPKPERDNAQPAFYDPNTGVGQRYFYMVEAPQSFKHILEGIEHTYHCAIEKHSYDGAPKMLPRYFSDGDV